MKKILLAFVLLVLCRIDVQAQVLCSDAGLSIVPPLNDRPTYFAPLWVDRGCFQVTIPGTDCKVEICLCYRTLQQTVTQQQPDQSVITWQGGTWQYYVRSVRIISGNCDANPVTLIHDAISQWHRERLPQAAAVPLCGSGAEPTVIEEIVVAKCFEYYRSTDPNPLTFMIPCEDAGGCIDHIEYCRNEAGNLVETHTHIPFGSGTCLPWTEPQPYNVCFDVDPCGDF